MLTLRGEHFYFQSTIWRRGSGGIISRPRYVPALGPKFSTGFSQRAFENTAEDPVSEVLGWRSFRWSAPGCPVGWQGRPLYALSRGATTLTEPSMLAEHRLRVAAQRRLAVGTIVKHVAARVLHHRDTRGIAHDRHLINGQNRTHEWAGEIVPSMHNQDPEFRIGGYRLPQIGHGAGPESVALTIPLAIHLIAQGVVSSLRLPPDYPGHEIYHRRGRGRDDALQNRVVGPLVWGKRERVKAGHVRIVDAADFPLLAEDLPQISANLEAPAGSAHKFQFEAGHLGHMFDNPGSGFRVGPALQQVDGVLATGIGDHPRHVFGSKFVLPLQAGGGNRRQGHHPRHRRD